MCSLYCGQEAAVRAEEHGETELFPIGKGTRQRCTVFFSTCLFRARLDVDKTIRALEVCLFQEELTWQNTRLYFFSLD